MLDAFPSCRRSGGPRAGIVTIRVDPADVARFRELVAEQMGLRFDDERLGHVADVLRERIAASHAGRASAYLERLAAGSRDEIRALAQRLTVGETYFFRYFDQFRAFAEVVLPDRAAYRKETRVLRVLSAGCASGEEAYSLAILIRENLPDAAAWTVEILGIDVNPAMI